MFDFCVLLPQVSLQRIRTTLLGWIGTLGAGAEEYTTSTWRPASNSYSSRMQQPQLDLEPVMLGHNHNHNSDSNSNNYKNNNNSNNHNRNIDSDI